MTPEKNFHLVSGQLIELLQMSLEAVQMGETCTQGMGRMAAEKCTRLLSEHRETLSSERERLMLEEIVWTIRKHL